MLFFQAIMSFSVVVVQYLVPCAIVTVCYLSICRLPNPPPMASNCSRRRQGLYNLKHTSHYKIVDTKKYHCPKKYVLMIWFWKTKCCRKVSNSTIFWLAKPWTIFISLAALQTLSVMKTGFSLRTFLYREKPLVMKTGFSL